MLGIRIKLSIWLPLSSLAVCVLWHMAKENRKGNPKGDGERFQTRHVLGIDAAG